MGAKVESASLQVGSSGEVPQSEGRKVITARQRLSMVFTSAFRSGLLLNTCEKLVDEIEDAAFERGRVAEREVWHG